MADIDFVQVPPDSTGKRLLAVKHLMNGQERYAQGMTLVSGADPKNVQDVDNRGAAYVRFTEGMPIFEAFGRQKMVQQRILGVYEHSQDSYDDLFTIVTENDGTSTFVPQRSVVVLATTTAAGSRCCRTTNRYHYYQPGNTTAVLITTLCGDAGKENVVRRWGMFDDNNGLFFELNGTTKNVVLRSDVSGTVEETRVAQADFNGDKLDGTGKSGMTVLPDRLNLYWIDIAWSGAIRMGVFDPAGDRIVCHTFMNPNTVPMRAMRSASLPFRTEILNTGAAVSASELHEGSCTVRSEGETDYTYWRRADFGSSLKTLTVAPTSTPLISVRSKPTLTSGFPNHVNAFPETLAVFATAATELRLGWPDTLTGATWALPGASTLEGDDQATSVADWTWDLVFMVEGGKPINIDLRPFFELNDEGILYTLEGVSYPFSIVATPLTETETKCKAVLTYRELY